MQISMIILFSCDEVKWTRPLIYLVKACILVGLAEGIFIQFNLSQSFYVWELTAFGQFKTVYPWKTFVKT